MRLEMKISLGSKSSPLGAAYAKRSPIYQIAALSGMALLLVVVATLQYKSATQLSAATEVRLGNNLQLLMTGWHRDLYDELSAGCNAMQNGAGTRRPVNSLELHLQVLKWFGRSMIGKPAHLESLNCYALIPRPRPWIVSACRQNWKPCWLGYRRIHRTSRWL